MKYLLSVCTAALLTASTVQAIEIEVGYPYSHLFDVTYEKIMKDFTKAHPDITVKFRATYEHYEDATQVVLREAVSGNLPDVTMQGLNRQAIFVEKGIAKSLEPYIAKEANFEKDGYHKAMLDFIVKTNKKSSVFNSRKSASFDYHIVPYRQGIGDRKVI